MASEIFGHTFNNATNPHWEPEPTRRGTFGILSTCIVTLGLCVWTAIHLNVPRRKEGTFQVTIRKIGWVIMGLLSPELIAYMAFQQYIKAKSLVATMNSGISDSVSEKRSWKAILSWFGRLGTKVPDDEESLLHPSEHNAKWTMTHGFFAAMGGFAIEFHGNDDNAGDSEKKILNFFPAEKSAKKPRTFLTLTPEGIELLKKSGKGSLIPKLPKELIKDKSKGSAFAKTLVYFQAFWFCAQCFARFSQKLPISLLELNTFGHALCTLLIYWLWWHKPLDIEQPERLKFEPNMMDDRHTSQLIAAMCCRSKLDRSTAEADSSPLDTPGSFMFYVQTRNTFSRGMKPQKIPYRIESYKARELIGKAPAMSDLELRVSLEEDNVLIRLAHLWQKRPCESSRQSHVVSQSILSSRDFIKAFNISCHRPETYDVIPPHSWISDDGLYDCSLQIRCSDLRRWQLALEYEDFKSIPPNLFTDRVRNLPRFDNFGKSLPFLLGFGFVGLIYGGLHCIAWNAPFASDIEQLLWRISSLAITGTGVLVALLLIWTRSGPIWTRNYYPELDPLGDPIRYVMSPIQTFLDYLEGHEWVKSHKAAKITVGFINWLWFFIVLLPVTGISLFLKFCLDFFILSCCLVYAGARIYLVGVSFYNLAFLPDEAYTLVQWARYVPHLG